MKHSILFVLWLAFHTVGSFHLSQRPPVPFALGAKGINKRSLRRVKADIDASRPAPPTAPSSHCTSDGPTDHSREFLDKARMDGVAEVTSAQSEAEIKAQVHNIVAGQRTMVEVLSAVKGAVNDILFKEGWEAELEEGAGALWVDALLDEKTRAAVAQAVSLVDIAKEEVSSGLA